MPNICLCADDFAMNPAISNGILTLVQAERLHAVSCMTQAADWSNCAADLMAFHTQVDIGLHFNLTHAFDDSTYAKPLPSLMLLAWSRQLNRQAVLHSLQQQWDRFVAVTGQVPDFIDGHQHVHQFPVVRDILLEFLIGKHFQGWVRNLQQMIATPNHRLKSQLLRRLGATTLHDHCQQLDIPQNQQFAGVYDFSKQPYAPLMQHWLAQAKDDLLIMCHPALPNQHVDVIAAARAQEYQYLISDQFAQDCKQHQITLSPLSKRS